MVIAYVLAEMRTTNLPGDTTMHKIKRTVDGWEYMGKVYLTIELARAVRLATWLAAGLNQYGQKGS